MNQNAISQKYVFPSDLKYLNTFSFTLVYTASYIHDEKFINEKKLDTCSTMSISICEKPKKK